MTRNNIPKLAATIVIALKTARIPIKKIHPQTILTDICIDITGNISVSISPRKRDRYMVVVVVHGTFLIKSFSERRETAVIKYINSLFEY